MTNDSLSATLQHSLRVGTLMGQAIGELVTRSTKHDHSKTVEPERSVFDKFTPRLKTSTYGSVEYAGFLAAMKPALDHHYANNRHHPEHFGPAGINGMTLVDLIEMLADWRASTERHDDGSLAKSLTIQKERFGISDQLLEILRNTALWFGWLDCGVEHTSPDGTKMRCSFGAHQPHALHCDGRYEPYDWPNEDFPKPLVSESTIAEAAAMEERDRAAGGFPWEVPDHPDHQLPGGWHRGQITGSGGPYGVADYRSPLTQFEQRAGVIQPDNPPEERDQADAERCTSTTPNEREHRCVLSVGHAGTHKVHLSYSWGDSAGYATGRWS